MFCYRRRSGIMGISRILGILGILAYLFGIFGILDRLNHIEINMQWNHGQSNPGPLDWHPYYCVKDTLAIYLHAYIYFIVDRLRMTHNILPVTNNSGLG